MVTEIDTAAIQLTVATARPRSTNRATRAHGQDTTSTHVETQQQESAYRRTESTTPLGEDTPPMVAVMGQSPSASELGTWIATW